MDEGSFEKIKLLAKIIIPIVLLAAGIAFLALRLPGWSLIFGIPMTVIGTVFLIYVYDEILTTRITRKSQLPLTVAKGKEARRQNQDTGKEGNDGGE